METKNEKSNLEMDECNFELYDGYKPISDGFSFIDIPNITNKIVTITGLLEAPLVIFAGYTDVNDITGIISTPSKKKVTICGGIFVPKGIENDMITCSRNGGVHSPLIYKIRFSSNGCLPKECEYKVFIFKDILPLEVNDTFNSTFATIFLQNKDPKTSRGTVTTILKSS